MSTIPDGNTTPIFNESKAIYMKEIPVMNEAAMKSPTRPSSVFTHLNQISDKIEHLQDQISRLQDRINPVLSPSPCSPQDTCGDELAPASSELGARLGDYAERLSNQVERLIVTIDSIDL